MGRNTIDRKIGFILRLKAALRVFRNADRSILMPAQFQLDDIVMYGRHVSLVVSISFRMLDTELGYKTSIFYTVRLGNGTCIEVSGDELQPVGHIVVATSRPFETRRGMQSKVFYTSSFCDATRAEARSVESVSSDSPICIVT